MGKQLDEAMIETKSERCFHRLSDELSVRGPLRFFDAKRPRARKLAVRMRMRFLTAGCLRFGLNTIHLASTSALLTATRFGTNGKPALPAREAKRKLPKPRGCALIRSADTRKHWTLEKGIMTRCVLDVMCWLAIPLSHLCSETKTAMPS